MTDELAEKIKAAIRHNLIDLRIENDMTQTDVGKLVGRSKTAVASWEQGLATPDITTLYRLSVYYGRTLNYMMGVEEDANS